MENKMYAGLLSQGSFLILNKKLIAILGLEMAVFISYLLDRYNYYSNMDLLDNGSFYATDNDIFVFTGLKTNKIQFLKTEGEKLNLFSIVKKGIPKKNYYNINFFAITDIFLKQGSIEELSYERIFEEKIDKNKLDYNSLKFLTRKELRILCKKERISYTGTDKKETLIEKIMRCEKKEVFNKDELNNMSFIELRKECKKMNISYTGKDNKNSLTEKILGKSSEVPVTEKIGHKCTDNLVTSDQKNWTKLKQSIITNNQKQITTTSSSFERYDFLDLEEFNLLNKGTKNNIRKNINNLDLEKFKKVYDFIKKKLENGKIKNFNGFLYELLNKEWDINIQSEEVAKKEVSEDKKKWLNYYSGIMTNQALKEEVEKLIIEIPLEILNKNKSKLGMMNGFEFKQHLYVLKKQSISS